MRAPLPADDDIGDSVIANECSIRTIMHPAPAPPPRNRLSATSAPLRSPPAFSAAELARRRAGGGPRGCPRSGRRAADRPAPTCSAAPSLADRVAGDPRSGARAADPPQCRCCSSRSPTTCPTQSGWRSSATSSALRREHRDHRRRPAGRTGSGGTGRCGSRLVRRAASGHVLELDADYLRLRRVKSEEELAHLRVAGRLTNRLLAAALVAAAVPVRPSSTSSPRSRRRTQVPAPRTTSITW